MGKKAVSKLFYCTSIALTFVLAGITIAGAFAGHIPPEHSTLMPFIGLALSGLLLINLAVAIYWGIRRRFWIIIPLIAIAANWQYLGRIPPSFFCGSGEIGRRTRFRFWRRKVCEFKSRLPHHSPESVVRMGYRQAVRHRFLIPAFPGSNPGTPAIFFE